MLLEGGTNMLSDGFYENGLITFSQIEKGNTLDLYCKSEGLDYQHLLSEINKKNFMFLKKIGLKKMSKTGSDSSN